jgi:hypothetical protein
MNKYRWVWMSFILIIVLTLGACAQPAVIEETPEPPAAAATATRAPATATLKPTEPEVKEPTEEEAAPVEPTPVEEEAEDDDSQMQALISDKIGGCHMLNFILSQNKTREEWSVTIDRMIGKGAKVNAEEKELIIDYLVSRNP